MTGLARNNAKHLLFALGMSAILLIGSGCRWMNPSAVGRYESRPLIQHILSQLDIAEDEPHVIFPDATEVRLEDMEVVREDYRIKPNDVVSVEVSDLVGLGVSTVVTKRVSETGRISLPLIRQVSATGMTEAELEERIVEAYRDGDFIQDAQVTATVIEPRGRTFSIRGAVGAPGQYAILNADFRVMDALVLARDISAVGVDNIYVIRQLHDPFEPADPDDAPPMMDEPDDLLAPRGRGTPGQRWNGQAMATRNVQRLQVQPEPGAAEGDVTPVEPEPEPATDPADPLAPADPDDPLAPAEPVEPVDPVDPVDPADPIEPAEPMVPDEPFEFNDIEPESEIRVIRIPVRELLAGDLRYNIVIRPRDMIVVPEPEVGFYYVAGHVMRPGVYNLTGQQITLKQAIMSAAMFDGLAIPKRTDLIRRIGPDREVIVQVDLSRLFAGADPDIFLKPHDQILVGTDWYAPFLAAARGAFRMTYGFGFLYDRNFAVSRDRLRI